MEYRRLGNSGLFTSLFALGTWSTIGESLNLKDSSDMLVYAYDNGINVFDTAETYNKGKSEEVLGVALNNLQFPRETFVLTSKVYWGTGIKKPNTFGLSRKHIFEGCHASLQRLKVDYLDILYCHRPDPNTTIEETVAAMSDLVRQGKIFYWGTSEWSAPAILSAIEIADRRNLVAPIVEQPQYNLFFRHNVEQVLKPLCKKYGLGLTTWSPLCSGLLTGKYNGIYPQNSRLNRPGYEWLLKEVFKDEKDARLAIARDFTQYCQQLGFEPTHVALAWCANNKDVSSVIMGASNLQQLQQNLKAINALATVSQEVFDYLNERLFNNASINQELA